MAIEKHLSDEELAEFYNFQEKIDEEEFCCPDGSEPFPDFSLKLEDFIEKDLLEIGPIDLANLTYGKEFLTNPKETYTFKEVVDARNEVASNFLGAFNIQIRTK